MRLGWLERRAGTQSRGLWLVRAGLWLYDLLARDPQLARHAVHRVGEAGWPAVDATRYRWLCSFFDAQISFPERFVVAMLADARQAAQAGGTPFRVLTYHQAVLTGEEVSISDLASGAAVAHFRPDAIVNATGAWVDSTLGKLGIDERPLMGGTKGSHFLTSSGRLRKALGGRGLYAEASDGRPVFILPLGQMTLVGTTDLPFMGDPADAVASDAELDYLLAAVNHVMPSIPLVRSDIDWHYSGVRPLPQADASTPGAITRRHWLEPHPQVVVPLYSVIGGKLTTSRSLAEQTADTLFARLGIKRRASTRQRLLPGAEDYPADSAALARTHAALAAEFGLRPEAVERLWGLFGTRVQAILRELGNALAPRLLLADTCLPRSIARWIVQHEDVRHLADLVERRLMLLYDPELPAVTLVDLAELLVETGKLTGEAASVETEQVRDRLLKQFGKRLVRVIS
jgi:glycerol-3-phosphate dehydrogenase